MRTTKSGCVTNASSCTSVLNFPGIEDVKFRLFWIASDSSGNSDNIKLQRVQGQDQETDMLGLNRIGPAGGWVGSGRAQHAVHVASICKCARSHNQIKTTK